MTITAVRDAVKRRSSIVLKAAMAASGLVMLGYLLVHAYGNLKFFQGQEYYDKYLHNLNQLFVPYLPEGAIMWGLRLALTVSVLVHVYAAMTLWHRNNRAAGYQRGTRYHSKKHRTGMQRSYSTFTLRWGGVILLIFAIGHVLQMMPNWLALGGPSDSKYQRVVNGFEIWWVVLAYTIALIAVGVHLWHGFWSAAATLGQNRSNTRKGSIATPIAWVLSTGLVVTFLLPAYAVFFFGVGR